MNRKTGLTLALILALALVAGCASSLPDRVTQRMFASGLHVGESRQDVRAAATRLSKTEMISDVKPTRTMMRTVVIAHVDRNGVLQNWTMRATSAAM
jgi:hypothetical protein